ncbi:tyrosine-type recombinase/integrase [Nocardia sp. NPDC020380]|uniref:tyrosine-type recombinase/integrase n=1 Tax=Nocardia sp. NPDC020380 TaxID=3364309 RepID=UPI0037A03C2B
MKPTTRIATLADIWLAEVRLRGHLAPSTLAAYEYQLDRSGNRRTRPGTIKIKPTIGNLTVREANTARMNDYMVMLMERGHTAKAAQHWSILAAMFDTARRHGALDHNPMNGTLKPVRSHDDPHVLPHSVFDAFQEQVAAWCRGADIPGTLGPRNGHTRDDRIYWIIQLLRDTGVRPGELLGFRIQDLELDAAVPGIWVRGKIEDLGADVGWRWRPGTKTGSKGIRRLALTPRGIDAVRHLLAYGISSDDNLLIPSPRGKGWSLHNFEHLWRAVRGSTFTEITPTQIRHRVGTDVRDIYGIEAASAQLGNSPLVAARYYAARNLEVDNRAALEQTTA